MAKGKYERRSFRRKRNHKTLTLVLSIALILALAAGGTVAYVVSRSGSVENKFEPAYVTSRVNVTEDKIDVTNTGDVDAYIRAAIVVNWMDASGNVRGASPVAGTDYELTLDADDTWADTCSWYRDPGTGFYYYKTSVASMGVTADLVKEIDVLVTPPAGYELSVEVVAEAIQAEGTITDAEGTRKAVADAWHITIYG